MLEHGNMMNYVPFSCFGGLGDRQAGMWIPSDPGTRNDREPPYANKNTTRDARPRSGVQGNISQGVSK